MFRGKKYQNSVKLLEKGVTYEPADAMDLVVKTASAKFDETVELHVRLGVDSRHAAAAGPRRHRPAQRHRQERPGAGVRQGRQGRRRP